ncbi:hypothetical protein JOF43_000624 [Brachybacterium sacelli]|uniref:Uncharacterized protein n=1 Tax=Brachybacterium sacelli TaxID=173364 RepID=A0ABS4WWT3_9MICO|nr:hypothetical protein [Brachybacterium sacelli]
MCEALSPRQRVRAPEASLPVVTARGEHPRLRNAEG